jgi:hypothetical protein
MHGEIIFCREDDDGTVIVLTCEDLESLDDVIGPVIVPQRIDEDADPKASKPPPGSFPVVELFAQSDLSPASDQPLLVDISEMPRGLLIFNPRQLTHGAFDLLEVGETHVTLNEQSAHKFGFTRTLNQQRTLEH